MEYGIDGDLKITLKEHKDCVQTLILLDAETLATGSDDNTIKLWNITTGQVFQTLLGHTSSVYCLQLLLDQTLVSSSLDKSIKLWNIKNNQMT